MFAADSLGRRLVRHPSAPWALGVIGLFVIAAVFAPLIAPHSPTAQLDIVGLRSQPPSLAHPFGTDRFSRDVLSRVLHGGRISLAVATLAVLLSVTLGTAYGLVAGFAGGRVDAILMRVLDAFLAIPRVLLLLAVLVLWYPVPVYGLILLIGLTGWFGVSRLVRGEVLAAREREYVAAARALGASDVRIAVRHVLPNVIGPLIVVATLAIGNVIVLEAGLSFLGIGAREPVPSWGSIFQDGSEIFAATWWVALFPGLAIVGTVLAFNVLGDALRDVVDPRQVETRR